MAGGPVRQPYAEVDIIPQSGSTNSATGLLPALNFESFKSLNRSIIDKTHCLSHKNASQAYKLIYCTFVLSLTGEYVLLKLNTMHSTTKAAYLTK
jgi:hypothetical protein